MRRQSLTAARLFPAKLPHGVLSATEEAVDIRRKLFER
jgi:hypothetical protein